MRSLLVMVAILTFAPLARAEEGMRCEELHCFCNGTGQPSTKGSCNSTCEEICGTGPSKTRPAHLSRAFLGFTGGRGFGADYAGGRSVRGDDQLGCQLEAVFGRPSVGLSVFLDLARDAGSSPDATAASPMWLFDFGLGLVIAPFKFRPGPHELRPSSASTASICSGSAAIAAIPMRALASRRRRSRTRATCGGSASGSMSTCAASKASRSTP